MVRDTRFVLVLTANDDVHSDFVVARLRELEVPVLRVDPGSIANPESPYSVLVGDDDATFALSIEGHLRNIDRSSVRSVFLRRPSDTMRPPSLQSDDIFRYFDSEARIVSDALSRGPLSNVPWVNRPEHNRLAANKIGQLYEARRAGLRIPPTLITSKPSAAYDFYLSQQRDLVVKPASSARPTDKMDDVVFTTRLGPDLDQHYFRNVRFGSSILQRRIEKTSDVRVAVVGDTVLGCEILSQTNVLGRTDWRAARAGLPQRVVEVPDFIGTALSQLRRALTLETMHVDFAVDAEGAWWFLETNPNGQWLWLELEVGLPISATLANRLMNA